MNNPAEIIEAFIECFETEGMPAHAVENGADFYECPSCGADRPDKGYLRGTSAGIESIEHHEWCDLMKAYRAGKAYLESLDSEDGSE